MIVKPKVRGFICTTAHPEGCEAHVQEQIAHAKKHKVENGAKNVLIIGSSTGFGLASRIAATFSCGANTIGVFYEKPSQNGRTASAGWYNTVAFDRFAREAGVVSKSINGDAFSDEIKEETIQAIKDSVGKVDLVIYSVASPRRTHPKTGETFTSVLKPIGGTYSSKTVNTKSDEVSNVSIEPATEQEVQDTVAVMGGEDWQMWMDALQAADVLEQGVKTLSFSYIGPELTYPIYTNGAIGKAKEDLDRTAKVLNESLSPVGGKAYVSVNKALVTQSSSAIPVVPLYISILFKVMKEKGIHEGCGEQMVRMFADRLYGGESVQCAEDGRIRMDDWEMREDVQAEVAQIWEKVNSDNLYELSDIEGYKKDFMKLFGFEFDKIDYEKDVDVELSL
ncbi:enoyl-ACP reductase FabV [Longirhabdus pacifica]|uniref:enoyl-ACP reductase FabV n=1 Tax=Longirhabdus pacifica TaxID=2305227 RepID=UPI001008F607|nr:enoyl-ACP reductase FabV [Longirhabdus pacifica]